jgi:class 3 adenylate cyclase
MDSNLNESDLPLGTVTFLFTDIQGSTRLLQTLGDQYAQVLADQRRIVRDCLKKWEGRGLCLVKWCKFSVHPQLQRVAILAFSGREPTSTAQALQPAPSQAHKASASIPC